MTGARLPTEIGMHHRLLQQQQECVRRWLGVFQRYFRLVRENLEDFQGVEEEARVHHADPHEKRIMRINGWKDMNADGTRYRDKHYITPHRGKLFVIGFMKPEEYAKFGKKPRLVVDIGISGSLASFRIMDILKHAVAATPFVFDDGEVSFVLKPDEDALVHAFTRLRTPPKRWYAVVFSDDCCFSVRVGSDILRFNFDLSNCDASIGPSIFELLEEMPPANMRCELHAVLSQCLMPLKIRSLVERKSVLLRPKFHKMYSGNGATTLLDTIGNFLCVVNVAYGHGFSSRGIQQSARDAGFILTGTEPLARFQELQFLKHSPVELDDGTIVPVLNAGVWVRAWGACKRDLPGRGDFVRRAEAFQRGLLTGMYPSISFPAKQIAQQTNEGVDHDATSYARAHVTRKVLTGYRKHELTDEQFLQRYNPDASDIEQFRLFAALRVGQEFSSPFIAKILKMDYDLGLAEGAVDSTELFHYSKIRG